MTDAYTAYLKQIRISPRKARLVVDLIRGRSVQEALDMLAYTNKRAAPILTKMLRSAIASASSQATVDIDALVVSEAFVDQGPTMKRFLPRAQGRATPIRKRSSHITVRLREV